MKKIKIKNWNKIIIKTANFKWIVYNPNRKIEVKNGK